MIIKKILILALMIFVCAVLPAQHLWTEMQGTITPSEFEKYKISISQYKVYNLDLSKLKDVLSSAPDIKVGDKSLKGSTVKIPMPSGEFLDFELYKAPVLHPDLARSFPGIESFSGKSLQDPSAYLRCDYSPEGFNCMILSAKYGTIFIDPMSLGKEQVYVVYVKKNYSRLTSDPFTCLVEKELSNQIKPQQNKIQNNNAVPDCILRTYRLALACTGEYASFHGGTKPKVLAAMNKTITRVSGVYERDLGVSFQIIANNDLIIYLNAATDPYTNDEGGIMLDENQLNIDNKIGKNNYDIGHVFSTGGGGIASLSSVCSSSNKAQGVTGLNAPIGDGFDIDYVAHEMGHQFNADHSFNNECDGNISFATAYEPGSGTTIMGYAGVCAPNVLFHSDDYFHVISLDEITTYITQQTGNTCGIKNVITNSSPIVNAGLNKTIPKNTPFELTAVATDTQADSLSYCWEQFDNEVTAQPPTSSAFEGPVFRSFEPTISSTRVFPVISDIVNNSAGVWEALPGVARVLNFRVTVRDNHPIAGCYATDDVKLTVSGTSGPFQVTYPNTNISWTVGDTQTVTWNVAQTNLTPVSSSKVDIYLSVDGGYTYPYILKAGVNNDGSQEIVVPEYTGNMCRIKIKGSNNYFFDISNTNFSIKLPLVPTFTYSLQKESDSFCASEINTLAIKSYISSFGGFNDSIKIKVDSLPLNTTAEIILSPGIPLDSATILIKNIDQLIAGSYTVYLTATSSNISKQTSYTFNISNGLPAVVQNTYPSDHAKNVSPDPIIQWEQMQNVTGYFVQVSTDPAFANIVSETSLAINQLQLSGLEVYKVYYWRVFADNYCGRGLKAVINSFQTISSICEEYVQTSNVTIPNNSKSVKTSMLNLTDNDVIISLDVKVNMSHNYISDIILDLTGPDAKSVSLFNGSCGSGQDMDVIYSDKGNQLICQAFPPAVSGIVKPAQGELNQWAGQNSKGIWTLRVEDTYPEDGGILDEWSLNICRQDSSDINPGIPKNKTLFILENTSKTIDSSHLRVLSALVPDEEIQFVLTTIPPNGTLLKGLQKLKVGSVFTQSDIDQHNIVYMQSEPGNSLDSFTYDILDINGNWSPNHTFNIIIYKALDQEITSKNITCNSYDNGEIHLKGINGIKPYLFSIDSGLVYFLTSDFTGLTPGTYHTFVKDSLGNLVEEAVVISQPEPLSHTISTIGNNIFIIISGGTQPYSTSIDSLIFTDTLEYLNLPNGDYKIYIKDANDCTNLDSVSINLVSTHNINSELWKIYPVPSSGIINIKSPESIEYSYSLYDNSGKTLIDDVYVPANVSKNLSFNIEHLSNGLYLLIIKSKAGVINKKLILQR